MELNYTLGRKYSSDTIYKNIIHITVLVLDYFEKKNIHSIRGRKTSLYFFSCISCPSYGLMVRLFVQNCTLKKKRYFEVSGMEQMMITLTKNKISKLTYPVLESSMKLYTELFKN